MAVNWHVGYCYESFKYGTSHRVNSQRSMYWQIGVGVVKGGRRIQTQFPEEINQITDWPPSRGWRRLLRSENGYPPDSVEHHNYFNEQVAQDNNTYRWKQLQRKPGTGTHVLLFS